MTLPYRRHLLLTALLLPVVSALAQSPPPVGGPAEVVAEVPGARLLGSGTLRFMGLRIYDGRLWVGAAVPGSGWSDRAAQLSTSTICVRADHPSSA